MKNDCKLVNGEPECELLDMYCKQIGDSNKYKLKNVDNTFADASWSDRTFVFEVDL